MATETEAIGSGGTDRSLIVRAIWYVFVGWWATGFWLTFAWFLNLSIIGMPIGIKMINLTPKVLSLKEPENTTQAVLNEDGEVELAEAEQRSLVVRGIYFLFVGWWASGIWMLVAYAFTLSIVGIPIAIVMYNKLPAVVSLYRY